MFNCATCNDNQKRANGCTSAPRTRSGEVTEWHYPPNDPEVRLDRCPARVLGESPDIIDVFRTLNLAGGRVSISDQANLPAPYLEALTLAAYHQNLAHADRMKRQSEKRSAMKQGGRRHG